MIVISGFERSEAMAALGQGTLVSGGSVRGVARVVRDVQDVVALLGDPGVGEVILVTGSASAATVMPLLPEVRGVVCSAGGPTSHLAIVARDLDLTCVVGTELADRDALEGRTIAVHDDGSVTADE